MSCSPTTGAVPPYSSSPNPYPAAVYPVRSTYPQQNPYAQVSGLHMRLAHTWYCKCIISAHLCFQPLLFPLKFSQVLMCWPAECLTLVGEEDVLSHLSLSFVLFGFVIVVALILFFFFVLFLHSVFCITDSLKWNNWSQMGKMPSLSMIKAVKLKMSDRLVNGKLLEKDED